MTATVRVNHADAVIDAVRAVLPSPVPALVFTDLAASCVPTFSDRCHVLLAEDGVGTYTIQRPLTSGDVPDLEHRIRGAWSGQWVGAHTIQTAFHRTSPDGGSGYRGSVVHTWDDDYRPTETDVALAQLAVAHALSILDREQGRPPAAPNRRIEAQQSTIAAVRGEIRVKALAAASLDTLAIQRRSLAAYQDPRGRA